MKSLLSFACLIALTLLSASAAFADLAKQKPSEQPPKVVLRTHLQIAPDARAWEARLQITQSDLRELRAALDGSTGNTTIAASIAQSPVRTIIAGLLLFLSVSVGGVWLARSSSFGRTRKAIAAGLLVVAVLGAAAIITRGNAGPPPGYLNWKQLPKNISQGRVTSGELVIEVVPDQPNTPPGIKLLIPVNPKQTGDE